MQRKRRIHITKFDVERLDKLIEMMEETDSRDKKHIEELDNELRQAKIVPPDQIPPDVITMNSKVLVKDLGSGEETVYHLVLLGGIKIPVKLNSLR